MRRRLISILACAVVLTACDAAESRPPRRIDETAAVVRLAFDPATQIAEFVNGTPALRDVFEAAFEAIACDGVLPLAFEVSGVTDASGGGLGTVALVLGRERSGSVCAGTGRMVIEPISFEPGPGQIRLSRGPLSFENRILDGRVQVNPLIERLQDLAGDEGPGLGLPLWFELSMLSDRPLVQVDGGVEPDDGGVAGPPLAPGEPVPLDIRLLNGELRAVWTVRSLAEEEIFDLAMFPGSMTALHAVVSRGFQPDVDQDGDGLEKFSDEDGDGIIERCMDGDGAVELAPGCATKRRYADGYQVALRFRLQPVVFE